MKQHISKREYHPTTDQTVLPSDAYRHPGSHFVDLAKGVDKSSKILRSLLKPTDKNHLSSFTREYFGFCLFFIFNISFLTVTNW